MFIALFFSFLCSILEAVLLSITPSFIASQKGSFGEKLIVLKKDIDKPLSAILTLNTFSHTVGAAGVGAMAQSIWGESSLTIVSAIVTLLILIGSEIIPKTIGAVYWMKLAKPVIMITNWLTILLYPFVFFLQYITKFFKGDVQKSVLSRVDVQEVVKYGYREGLIRKHESDIIDNLMKKDKLLTREIMTPQERLVCLEESTTIAAIPKSSEVWHISRIPTYSKVMDQITGYVVKDELLMEMITGHKSSRVSTYKRKILKVSPETELKDLYHLLVSADDQIAIVEEAGRVLGLVTMEDVLEEILGQEIVDESDHARGVLD